MSDGLGVLAKAQTDAARIVAESREQAITEQMTELIKEEKGRKMIEVAAQKSLNTEAYQDIKKALKVAEELGLGNAAEKKSFSNLAAFDALDPYQARKGRELLRRFKKELLERGIDVEKIGAPAPLANVSSEDRTKTAFLQEIGAAKPVKGGLMLVPSVVADHVAKERHLISIREFGKNNDGSIYGYDDRGVYEEFDLAKHVRNDILPSDLNTVHNVTEIVAHVKDAYRHSVSEFDSNPDIINTLSGLMNRKTRQLRRHDPSYLSLIQLPVKYVRGARATKIRDFLGQVLVDDKQVTRMIEVVSSILHPKHPAKAIFFFTGSGDNGKSLWMEVLTTFLGKQNVEAQTLQRIAENRFSIASLIGKLANLAPDIPDSLIWDTGKAKAISGDDPVDLEKKFGRDWSQHLRVELIFACNQLPRVNDSSRGWFGRFEELPFPVTFSKEAGNKRPRAEIVAELTTEEAMSGLLNEALEVQADLEKRAELSYSLTEDEKRDRYLTNADVVFAFADHSLVQDTSASIKVEDLKKRFVEFCQKKRRIAVGQKELYKRLAKYLTFEDGWDGPEKKRYRVLKGLKFTCTGCSGCTESGSSKDPPREDLPKEGE